MGRRRAVNTTNPSQDPEAYNPMYHDHVTTHVARKMTSHDNPKATTAIPSQVLANSARWQSSDTGGSFTTVVTLKQQQSRMFFKDGRIRFQNPVFYLSRIDYVRDPTNVANLPNPVQAYVRINNGDYVYNMVSDTSKIFDAELFSGYALLFNVLQGQINQQEKDSVQNIMTPLGTLQVNKAVDFELRFIDSVSGVDYAFTDVMGAKGFVCLTLSGAFMQ